MKFCSACGTGLTRATPEGDDRERAVCPACDAIHYENPRNVVGCIVEHHGADGAQVLLCRRAIEPSEGRWTLPAGFLELDESLWGGAARETWEEARARVALRAPHAVLDLLHIGQVYTLFRAEFAEEGFAAGPESHEVELFSLDRIPFGELAFPVVEAALRLYVEDVRRGDHRMHLGHLVWSGEGSRFDASNYELRDHHHLPVTQPVMPGRGTAVLRDERPGD